MSESVSWSDLEFSVAEHAEAWLETLHAAIDTSTLTASSFGGLLADLGAGLERELTGEERKIILYQAFLDAFALLPEVQAQSLREQLAAAWPDSRNLVAQAWSEIAETRAAAAAREMAALENDAVIRERFEVIRKLGSGAFSDLHLARERSLDRLVVLKRLQPESWDEPDLFQLLCGEAKKLAGISHPNVRRIYSVEECGGPVQVLEYVDGPSLAEFLAGVKPPLSTAMIYDVLRFGYCIADALEEVHRIGLYHLDLKPANILLPHGSLLHPKVCDFGLSLARTQLWSLQGASIGTPRYMAPEQFAGKTALFSGKTDVWALGTILYEMIMRTAPFEGANREEVKFFVTEGTYRPVRELDPGLPFAAELDSIFKSCLEKGVPGRITMREVKSLLATLCEKLAKNTQHRAEGRPQGLSAFTERDHEYFLRLLPGQRDRHGVPYPVSQWLTQIDRGKDEPAGFRIAVIHGPSGCGKSSLVKAGLLPLLGGDVRNRIVAIDVDATPERTESDMFAALRDRCRELPGELDLIQSLHEVRDGRFLGGSEKVLLVLDQFEQWLQNASINSEACLVRALSQCNGTTLQAVVVVREDYWTQISQFMEAVGINPRNGIDKFFIDLFQPAHARTVLELFGEGYGKFRFGVTAEHEAFLDAAVQMLTNKGRVICVQLALFAKMYEEKPWNPESLREVREMNEVGVEFLNECFVNTERKEYQDCSRAAEQLLEALLPDDGTDLKGHMRPRSELSLHVDMAAQPAAFERLIAILESELRLIKSIPSRGENADVCYQLTHDYLVPSLREWLSRQQEKTEVGRAWKLIKRKGMLFEHSDFGSRSLPSLAEWIQIEKWIPERHRTPAQREMMAMAVQQHSQAIAERIVNCSTDAFPRLLAEVEDCRTVLGTALSDRVRDSFREAAKSRRRCRREGQSIELVNAQRHQLHAAVALAGDRERYANYLLARLLRSELHEIAVIRAALFRYRERASKTLLQELQTSSKSHEGRRLRAAAALVKFDPEASVPDSTLWSELASRIVNDLVEVPAVHLSGWMELLRPAADHLRIASSEVYRDRARRETDRSIAIAILAEYAANLPQVLAKQLVEADVEHFDIIFPLLERYGEAGRQLLQLDSEADVTQPPCEEVVAKQTANAAIARYRMGEIEGLWPLLRHTGDPLVRSYVIHRLAPCGVVIDGICERLLVEEDIGIRRALLLALGTFGSQDIPAEKKAGILPILEQRYSTQRDSGEHGAIEWLLGRWGRRTWLTQARAGLSRNLECLLDRSDPDSAADAATPEWRLDGRCQTFVVIARDAEFMMGSPESERDRKDEPRRRRVIPRSFGIAVKHVTWREFLRKWEWNEYLRYLSDKSQTEVIAYRARMESAGEFEDSPVNFVSWHMAADYCNWLSDLDGLEGCYRTWRDRRSIRAELKPDYLQLPGYRVPTEAEMECATRAGSTTARCYGESDELLAEYAWYAPNAENRTHAVGLLKPNDWGLFDVHGNVYTWCLDVDHGYQTDDGSGVLAGFQRIATAASRWWRRLAPSASDNGESLQDIEDRLRAGDAVRVLRGGMYFDQSSDVRSAYRYHHKPTSTENFIGFRLARTLVGASRPESSPRGR